MPGRAPEIVLTAEKPFSRNTVKASSLALAGRSATLSGSGAARDRRQWLVSSQLGNQRLGSPKQASESSLQPDPCQLIESDRDLVRESDPQDRPPWHPLVQRIVGGQIDRFSPDLQSRGPSLYVDMIRSQVSLFELAFLVPRQLTKRRSPVPHATFPQITFRLHFGMNARDTYTPTSCAVDCCSSSLKSLS